jgi:hypothetical protein
MGQRSEFDALMKNAGLDMLKEYDANDIKQGGYQDGKYPKDVRGGSKPTGYQSGKYASGKTPMGYDDEQLDEAPNYDAINLSRYRRAMRDGNLGNIGPVGPSGSSFSPNRWDKYADMARAEDEEYTARDGDRTDYFDEPDPEEEWYKQQDDLNLVGGDDADAEEAWYNQQDQASAQQDKRAEWDMRRADDQFDKLDTDYQARADKIAAAKAKKVPQAKASKGVGGIKGSLKDAVKGWNKGDPVPTPAPKPKQSLKDFEKTTPAQDTAIDDLITTTNKPKAGRGVPGITGSTISGNATMADPIKVKGAQNTDDFGNDLSADSNFAGQTRTPAGQERSRKLRNMQLNRHVGMDGFESTTNDAEPISEMDRMLRIAGLK